MAEETQRPELSEARGRARHDAGAAALVFGVMFFSGFVFPRLRALNRLVAGSRR